MSGATRHDKTEIEIQQYATGDDVKQINIIKHPAHITIALFRSWSQVYDECLSSSTLVLKSSNSWSHVGEKLVTNDLSLIFRETKKIIPLYHII